MEIVMIKELTRRVFHLILVFMLVNMRFLYAADEPFNVTIELQSPIVLSEINGLSFVSTPTGMNTDVVTAPRDALAATFSVRGNPNTAVTGSVVESSITMTTGAGGINEQIVVDNFTTGGGLNRIGKGTLRASGSLKDIRVGGTAHVKANNVAGSYIGTATFRLLY